MKNYTHSLKNLIAVLTCFFAVGQAFALGTTTIDGKKFRTIESCADLIAFSTLVNNGSYTANAIVTSNVDCDGVTTTTNPFTPIGKDASHKYQGTFLGNGNAINKLVEHLPDDDEQFGGLFGYLGANALVRDVILFDLEISAATGNSKTDYIGGIAGKSEGTISTCTVAGDATIQGRRVVGGILGYAVAGSHTDNSLCTASLQATGKSDYDQQNARATFVGGIIGRGELNATVTSCVYGGNSIIRQEAGGTVHTKNTYPIAGGPVTLEDCYFSNVDLLATSAAGNCGDESENSEVGFCDIGYDGASCKGACDVFDFTSCTWSEGGTATTAPKCNIKKGSTTYDVFNNKNNCITVAGADHWVSSACGSGTPDLTDESIICALNDGTMVDGICYGEQNDIWRDNGDITNHVTVKSTSDETSYAIIFNPNGGSFAGRTTSDTIYVVVNGKIDSARTAKGLTNPGRSTDEDVFVGWAKTYNANTELNDLGTVTGSVTFYAVWEKSIVVSFDANGGEFPNNPVTNKRVAKNRAIDTVGISVPSARGATFLGWSRNKNATVADETLGSSSDPVTFYAVYSGNYKVSFNSNGGSFSSGATREKTVSVGADFTAEGITQPNPPSGYTFAGWSLDQNADASEAISSSSAVIGTMRVSEITVYAVWSVKKWTITFDPNGGYFDNQNNSTGQAAKTKIFIDGEKINSNGISTTNPPVKRAKSGVTNYTFIGWAEISSSSTVLKDLGTASEDKTFYAVWATSGTYYTVTFDVNGFGSIPENQRVTKTQGAVSAPDVVSPAGVSFVGWYKEAACTNVFDFGKETVSKDMTLYAKWTVNTHTVNYRMYDKTSGEEFEDEAYSETVPYGTKVSVTTKIVPGFNYTAWQSESDNVIFADDGSFVMPDNDVELYCFRSTGVYTLTWDLKDGEDVSFEGEYSPAGQYNFGETIYAPILKRDGYTFEGWTLNGNDLVGFPLEMPNSDVKFYAKWKANGPYKLTIQVVGAPANVPIPSGVQGGTSVTLTVPDFTPSATGALYHFLGWEENYSDIEISSSNTFTMPNYDVRIIAKFVQKPVILYTKGECSTCTGDDIQIIKEYGASYTIKGSSDKVFSRTGYEHKGWTTVEGGSAVEYAFGATYSGNDNLTLYPVWEAVTLNLAWNFTLPEGWSADDISYGEFSAGSYAYGTQPSKPTVSKFGYDVDWYTTSECAANPAGTGCTAWNFDEDKLVGSQDETITLYGHVVKRTLTVTYHVLRETGGSDAYYFTKDYTIDDLYDSKYLYYNINENTDIPEDRIYVNGFGYVVWYKTSACTELATFLNFRSNGDFNTSVELYGLVDGYKITYHAGTGATGFDFVGRKTVGEDYTLEGAGRFTRVGFTQVGWTRTDGGTKALDLGATYNVDVGMESGLDLYPVWAQNRTVTLHLDDGTQLLTMSSSSVYTPVSGSSGVYTAVAYDGQKLEQPAIEKLGYQNETWYTSEDCANGTATSCSSWNFSNDVISGNTDLYVGAWEKIVKKITFHYGDNSFDSTYSVDDVNSGNLLAFGWPGRFENIDFIEGFGYVDWFREPTFENEAWGLNLSANRNFEDQDMYAELSGYKVTYKPGENGTGDEIEDAVSLDWFKEGGDGYNLRPATTFTRTGYSLTGWSNTENGEKTFDVDAEYKPTANATFYPVWTPVTYAITYMDGAAELDAQLNDAENPAAYNIETAVTLNAAKEKVDGETHYLFDGWFSEAGFENSVASIPLGSYGNKELYAKYTAGVAITYKVNDATHVDYAIPGTALVPFDTSKTGYSFSGWTWFDGENTEPLATAPTVAKAGLRAEGTLTLNVYEALFNANGGEFAAAATISKEVNFNADISAEGISIPTYAGHKFMGWAREASALKPDANLGKMDAEGVTFYAVWEDAYTIVYNMNGHGDEIAPAIYVLGSAAVAPTDPEVEGYTFGGWFTDDGEFKNAYDFASVVSTVQTINLYAKWTVHQHTITYRFKIAEDTYDVIQTDNVDYGASVAYGTIVQGEKFNRAGYENIGWTPKDVFIIKGHFFMPDNDVIVEGTGTPKNYPIVYHLPDGTSSSSNYTYSETDDFTLPTNIEVTDWTFSNWYDNAEHTGDAVTKIEKGTYGEKVFYGLYTQVITVTIGENTFPVTIDSDDDADDINEKILAEAHKQGIEDPTKTDPEGKVTYEFEKYNCTAGASGYTCEEVFTETYTEYTVAVNLPEGASLVCTEGATGAENCSADGKSIKYQYGEGASELPAAEMEGWTFDRWVDGSGNTVSSIGAEEFGNKSITPVFEKDITVTIGEKTFPVTIDNDDDADDINEKILAEAHKQGIEDPTKDSDDKYDYTFEKYECSEEAGVYTCEEKFNATGRVFEVAVNLPEGASLVCMEGATGAENCSADGKNIEHKYGVETTPLPAAEMTKTVDGATVTDDSWTFEGWFDNKNGIDDGTNGNKVTSIDAKAYGDDIEVFPYFTKDVVITLSEDPEVKVEITLDNNDDAASVSDKVNEAYDKLDPKPADPTKPNSDSLEYAFKKYECSGTGSDYTCEAKFDSTGRVFEVAVNLPDNAALVCTGDPLPTGAENCSADGENIEHKYGVDTKPLPDAVIVDDLGNVDDSWTFEGWFDNKNGIDDGTNGNKVDSIAAEAYGDSSIYPYFTKEIEVVIGGITVDVVIDNNDDSDSLNAKVNDVVAGLDPKPTTPTKPSSDKYDYEFKDYECSGSGIAYTCEAVFDSTGRVFEVVENLPVNAKLICDEGAKGAENCNAKKDGVKHQYGVETTPLPDAYIAGKDGKADDSWTFEGWFDNENGFDDGTNGNKVTSIDAEAYGNDIEIFPYFTKDAVVTLSEDPEVKVEITLDNNDDADSVSAKVNEAYGKLDPKPADPTKDTDDLYEYEFTGFDCDMDFTCEATFDSLPYKKDIEVVYGNGEDDILDVTIWSTNTDEEIEEAIEKAFADHDPAIPLPTKDADDMYVYSFDKFVKNPETGRYEPSFTKTEKSFKIVYHMPSEAKLSKELNTYVYGKREVLPVASIEGTKWEFKGWYTEENGLGTRVKTIKETDMGKKEFFAFFQMTLVYEVEGDKGSVEIIYTDDLKKAVTRALQGVVPEDYEEDGVTYTFDKWALEDDVYVAKFVDATGLKAVAAAPRFNVVAAGRTLQISGAKIGAKIAVFDMSGRLVTTSMVQGGTQLVELDKAGSYVVRINNQAARVNVR